MSLLLVTVLRLQSYAKSISGSVSVDAGLAALGIPQPFESCQLVLERAFA